MEAIAKQYVHQSQAWLTELECLFSLLSRHFGRINRQRHAWTCLPELLGTAKRKNGWQLAEAADHATPYSPQHLLVVALGMPIRCAMI